MSQSVRSVGNQPTYTIEIAAQICVQIAEGLSLREVCRQEGMPPPSTVIGWYLNDTPRGFAEQYERARQAKVERWADEIVEIADDGSNDWMERQTRSGDVITVVNDEHIRRSQLRVESRKWLMAKLMPKRYGDKIDVTSGNEPIVSDNTRDVAKVLGLIIEDLKARQEAAVIEGTMVGETDGG